METTTENKMGTKPVWSLLLTMALPVILSTAAQFLYNIVELYGAMLTVIDKDGNVVDRWTSVADEAHVIKRLAAGETYTLRLVRELAMVQCQYGIYQK